MTEAQFGRILAKKKAAAKLKAETELAALKRIWEGTPKYGKGALLEAFDLCSNKEVALPPWLARAVRAELTRSISKQTLKHYRRWREGRKMRDMRPVAPDTARMRPGRRYPIDEVPPREIGYEETLEHVADLLEKTSAAGATPTIKRSYELVENDLPPSQRYQRTYAKRTRRLRQQF